MKSIVCERCGANEWSNQNGYRVCKYCGTQFQVTSKDFTIKESRVAVNADVERLLKLCAAEPHNAKKYANLVLDIDPSNTAVLKYL